MCGVPGLAPSVSITTLKNYFRGKLNYVLCHLFQFSVYVLGNASISSKNSVVNHGQHQHRLKWEMELLTLAAEKTAEFGQNWKTIIFFFLSKNSRARLKESWVAWRCVGYPANNGGLLSWCCHLDEWEPGTSALISGCEYQTELQINHAPWLSSFSNKDKYVEIEDELSPLKAKL